MAFQLTNKRNLLRGGLVINEPDEAVGVTKVVMFQYNPDQLNRALQKREPEKKRGNAGGAKEDVMRAQGPPVEEIKLTVQLNAADQLADPDNNRTIVEHGLLPTLATLEMLLYPTNAQVLQNAALAGKGKVQLKPASLPLTLLVWGKSRVVPVLIKSFSVTEEAFDQRLNPIQAKVELGLQVLTYMELEASSQGRDVYMAFQEQKEKLAQSHQAGREESRAVLNLIPGSS